MEGTSTDKISAEEKEENQEELEEEDEQHESSFLNSDVDTDLTIGSQPDETKQILKSKSRSKVHRNIDEKKSKLRTSKDVYDRLKWDADSIQINDQPLELSSVYIGYKDRFLGMCELPYLDFVPLEGQGEIPFHRVYYFRTGGPSIHSFVGENGEVKVREDNLPPGAIFIWDRDSRTDLIFKSGNSFLT